MFLDSLLRRNRPLVEQAVALHQAGAVPANSYVLDLDALSANAATLKAEAGRLGLTTYPMTKQIGRNPAALDALAAAGLRAHVAVDMGCARPIHERGYHVGHLGHLVQIPRAEAAEAARMAPAHWTVFSDDKAREAAAASEHQGRQQPLLARIHAPGDRFYPGHEGGFAAAEIVSVAERLEALDGARMAGVTTFPALLFDHDTGDVAVTPNMNTIARAAEALRAAGAGDVVVNAPGTTSTLTLETLASRGATQVEPGHGLTATTPLHAVRDCPEQPAVCYVSEISHEHGGRPYCFGGGLYIDPVFPAYDVRAVVTRDASQDAPRYSVDIPPPEAIDYYGIIDPADGPPIRTGDTVVFGFRIQAFVTRALVAPVSGISRGTPQVEGIWTTDGRAFSWPR